MKKIGIDLRALQVGHEFRGIGAHTRSMIEALLKNSDFTNNEIVFYRYDSTNPLDTIRIPKDIKYREIVVKNPKNYLKKRSKIEKATDYVKEIVKNNASIHLLPKTWQLDCFIQFDQALGLPRNPFLNTIIFSYDIIPLVFKDDYLPSPINVYRRHNMKIALKTFFVNQRYYRGISNLKRAKKIVVNSNSVKNDLNSYLKIPSDKITLAHCSLPVQAKRPPVDLKREKVKHQKNNLVDNIIHNVKNKPYLLYVGGVESPRRRIEDLATAYHHLRANGESVALVLAGREFTSADSLPATSAKEVLKQLSYSEDVYLLGYLDDTEVHRLYKNAAAFVFPTLYEGFGLPLLECFAVKCQIISYKNSSLEEVGGEAAIFTQEESADAIVACVEKVLQGEKISDNVMNKQLEKFSWEESAKKVIELI
jgi:glycosyltransferase involved in cell wall biosynthesis